MNSHYAQFPNLRGMSVAAAMRLAIAYSGKPRRRNRGGYGLVRVRGKPGVQQRRLLAVPAFSTAFCAAVGNDIIPRWIMANVDMLMERAAPMDAVSLLASMGNLFREMADVARGGAGRACGPGKSARKKPGAFCGSFGTCSPWAGA